MNDALKQAALSLLRTTLAVAGGIAVGRGWITTEQSVEVGGALLVLVPAAWGFWNAYRSERATQAREHVAVQAGVVEARIDLRGVPAEAISSDKAQDIIAKLQEKTA